MNPMRWTARLTETPKTPLSAALRTGTLVAMLLAAHATLAGTPAASERALHMAECIAALDVKSAELAKQVKAGQTDLQAPLTATLEAGAAFIGHAYLQGDRDEARSQALLSAALETQKLLPEAELAARQTSCAQEGARLLSQADVIGRFVVSRLVQRRMQKLLGD